MGTGAAGESDLRAVAESEEEAAVEGSTKGPQLPSTAGMWRSTGGYASGARTKAGPHPSLEADFLPPNRLATRQQDATVWSTMRAATCTSMRH